MNAVFRSARSVGALMASFLTALIAFGLLLALAWNGVPGEAVAYKMSTLLVVSAVAMTAGGVLMGVLMRRYEVRAGLAFGLIAGACSFTYILGIDPLLALFIPASAGLGALGGWLAQRVHQRAALREA